MAVAMKVKQSRKTLTIDKTLDLLEKLVDACVYRRMRSINYDLWSGRG